MKINKFNFKSAINSGKPPLVLTGFILSVLLSACGGGSSGNDSTTTSSATDSTTVNTSGNSSTAATADNSSTTTPSTTGSTTTSSTGSSTISSGSTNTNTDTTTTTSGSTANNTTTSTDTTANSGTGTSSSGTTTTDTNSNTGSSSTGTTTATGTDTSSGNTNTSGSATGTGGGSSTIVGGTTSSGTDNTTTTSTGNGTTTSTTPSSGRYVKVGALGNELPASASSWSCVKDTTTGLLWETKTDDGGLQDKDWRYRHFHNYAGYASTVDYNGKTLCQNIGGSSCDAYSYVQALQSTSLCGRSNWRLPIPEELLNLAQYGSKPYIDLNYFPETVNNPGYGSYCTENLKVDEYGNRVEENYQGVDFSMPVYGDNLKGSLITALRFSGEVADGLTVYPSANWICYTRLVSNGQ